MIRQIAGSQPLGPRGQLGVGAASPLLARVQALQHPVDPFSLLRSRELGRNQDDNTLAVPICGHRAPSPLTASHLDDRLTGGHAGLPKDA